MLGVSNMNGKKRKKLYAFLVKRDGEFCNNCKKCLPEVNLVIDHIDNDNKNNSLDNLQLLCRQCNYSKNPRRPLDLSESEDEKEDETELQKSSRLRPLVRKFILHEINESNVVQEKELLDGGAELHSCSQQTIKRILDGMCSKIGILKKIKLRGITVIQYKDSFYER